jgi:hypothetical protein
MTEAAGDGTSVLDDPDDDLVAAAETSAVAAADGDDMGPIDVNEPVGGGRVAEGNAHVVRLLAAAVLGAGLAYAVDRSWLAALIGVAAVQAVLIVTWLISSDIPGKLGAAVLGVGAAVAADAVVTQWPHGELGTLVAVLGLSVPALFVHQLLRPSPRTQVVDSLSRTALLLVAVTALAGLLQLRHQPNGTVMATAAVLGICAALAVGHLVDWLWSPLRFDPAISRGLPAVIAALIAGGAVTFVQLHNSFEFAGQRAALLGTAIAAVAALFAVGVAFIEHGWAPQPSRPLRWLRDLAGPPLCLALTAPVAYLLCLVMRG